ncbi:matrixin family metalloprotease [Patescibacteria group bacterium]
MNKKNIFIYTICGLVVSLFAVSLALAAKPKIVNTSKGHAVVKIPARAVEVSPGIFNLGTALHNGEVVEGYAVFKRKEGFGKIKAVCGNGVCERKENAVKCPADCGGGEDPPVPPEPDTSSCYEFLAKGAKWKTVEPYIVNPANIRGLDEAFVADNLDADISKWELVAGVDILGEGSVTGAVLEADMVAPDYQNEVYFGDIEEPDVIAMAVVWGIFGGPPKFRKLVEWDMIFNEADYDWSASGEAGKMDFESIATHELGHAVGMGDLYTSECAEMTMYGYASNGETKKRTLEDGDINGAQELY